MRRRRENEDGSLLAIALGAVGVLAIAVGSWWFAVFLYTSVDGDVLIPVDEGRWSGAPTLFLVGLFGLVGLAGIGMFGFLAWLMVLAAGEGRGGRR
ncbi:hypothetical protein [Agromyces sp. GXQ0307]|uniref:hypothetical protein n=1 Tax=Agromyces sp. GXQ0307 TaxID=3377835 RepID=UPI00383BDDA0